MPHVSFSLSPNRDGTFILLFFTNDEHIRYAHQFSIPDLLANLLSSFIYLRTDTHVEQLLVHLSRVIIEFIADGQEFYLYRL